MRVARLYVCVCVVFGCAFVRSVARCRFHSCPLVCLLEFICVCVCCVCLCVCMPACLSVCRLAWFREMHGDGVGRHVRDAFSMCVACGCPSCEAVRQGDGASTQTNANVRVDGFFSSFLDTCGFPYITCAYAFNYRVCTHPMRDQFPEYCGSCHGLHANIHRLHCPKPGWPTARPDVIGLAGMVLKAQVCILKVYSSPPSIMRVSLGSIQQKKISII